MSEHNGDLSFASTNPVADGYAIERHNNGSQAAVPGADIDKERFYEGEQSDLSHGVVFEDAEAMYEANMKAKVIFLGIGSFIVMSMVLLIVAVMNHDF